VILGLESPDLNGFEVIGLMRARGVGAPVIFLSAHDGRPEAVAGLSLGGTDYVTRHRTSAELVARVAPLLESSGIRIAKDDLLRCQAGEPSKNRTQQIEVLRHLVATNLARSVQACRRLSARQASGLASNRAHRTDTTSLRHAVARR